MVKTNEMKGKVKFFKPMEYWGKVELSNGEDLYFNARDVQPELKSLLVNNAFDNEPVDFERVESERRPGEFKAVNVNLDFELRRIGSISKYDFEKGFGFIKNYHDDSEVFFHHTNLINPENRFIRVEVDEPVTYSVGENENGPIAVEVAKLDNRNHLQKFATFNEAKAAYLDLATLAEPENWDYIQNPQSTNPVLRSYLNQTIKRIQEQSKIISGKSSKDSKTYSYFNTGLVTKQQDEIFAYFIGNPDYEHLTTWGLEIPKWKFIEFNTDQSNYRRYFKSVPEIPTYFLEAEIPDLILDTRIPIIPDKDHLVKRKDRIQSERIKNLDDVGFVEEIKDSIELAVKRVKRNYKTAIPHFYDGRIQFLLPLCFRANKAEALAALVVNKNENIYEAHTILSLDQAYNNARLLAKPDREWLNP